jgi:hypothetical protein
MMGEIIEFRILYKLHCISLFQEAIRWCLLTCPFSKEGHHSRLCSVDHNLDFCREANISDSDLMEAAAEVIERFKPLENK